MCWLCFVLACIGLAQRWCSGLRLGCVAAMIALGSLSPARLALGILCARADGLAVVFASASAGLGGQVARRFLPLALIRPATVARPQVRLRNSPWTKRAAR